MMPRLLLALLALTLGCGDRGSVAWTVRDPSGSVVAAPATTARFDAARRELEELVGHPVALQIDASLLSNDLASFTEEYARMAESVIASLRSVQRSTPDAFDRVGKKLTAIDVRYDATLEWAKAKLEGTSVVVRSPVRARGDSVGEAIAVVVRNAYLENDGAKLYATAPAQIPPARREAYYEAIVGHRRFDKPSAEAPSWDPERVLVAKYGRGLALQKAIEFHAVLPAAPLRDKLAKHIAFEASAYLLSAWSAASREIAVAAPADSVLRRTQHAYVAYLQRQLTQLPENVQSATASQMFPRHDELAAEHAFAGFDRVGYALDIATAMKRRKAASASALEDAIVCPYREDASGRLDRRRSCSTAFYAIASAHEDTRKRLARFLIGAGPSATQTAFANLRWSPQAPALELFHDLEAEPNVRDAAGKVLGDLFGRENEWRDGVRKEGYALYTRRADARGIALYMILATDPYRGLEAVTAGLTPKLGATELRDLLAVAPRSMTFVASGWSSLPFSKAALVGAYLTPSIPTDTVLALARAACQEGQPAELAQLRLSMENAARRSPTDRSRFDGAIEMLRPQACPPPSR